jgi:hypothetical protein
MCQAFSLDSQMSSPSLAFAHQTNFCPSPHACDGQGSPNLTSTSVLLTLAVPKPNLPLDTRLVSLPLRRKSIERRGWGSVYRFETGS